MSWQPAARTSLTPTPTRQSTTPESEHIPIIECRVGDAVRTDESRGDHDTTLGTEVDPQTWKHLVLKCNKTDGSTSDVELLRPTTWLKLRQAKVGGTIEISVPECAIEGDANVLDIRSCPNLQPTPPGFRTVTGTFRHESADVLDIYVKGISESIGTTAVHPFWSEDRKQYIHAAGLTVGEHLLGANGPRAITAIRATLQPEPVYNLEVHHDHNFHVSCYPGAQQRKS